MVESILFFLYFASFRSWFKSGESASKVCVLVAQVFIGYTDAKSFIPGYIVGLTKAVTYCFSGAEQKE